MKHKITYIPYDTTPVSLCKRCKEQVITKYSMRKNRVRYKTFNIDGTKHTC